MRPISDDELSAFETMHQCPNLRPEGGCQKCEMVERIRQQERTIYMMQGHIDASGVELQELRAAKTRIDKALEYLKLALPSSIKGRA